MIEFWRLGPAAVASFGEKKIDELKSVRARLLHFLYFYLHFCPASHFMYVPAACGMRLVIG